MVAALQANALEIVHERVDSLPDLGVVLLSRRYDLTRRKLLNRVQTDLIFANLDSVELRGRRVGVCCRAKVNKHDLATFLQVDCAIARRSAAILISSRNL